MNSLLLVTLMLWSHAVNCAPFHGAVVNARLGPRNEVRDFERNLPRFNNDFETEAPPTGDPETLAPLTQDPETERPGTEGPETEIPVTEGPETERPVTEGPETERPVTEGPETERPVTEGPETERPVTEGPETERPVTEGPETERPATEMPVTETPETEAPVTEGPETEAPVTEEPETEAPVTEEPETEAPFTSIPTTRITQPIVTGAPEVNVDSIGCFDDLKNGERALPILLANLRDEINWYDMRQTVQGCARIAAQSGFEYFGVQFYGECWVGANGALTYNRFGPSKNCWEGVGRHLTNYVYRVSETT